MRRSITGPVIVVTIGVLFLLRNLRPDLPAFSLIGSYWPFLLIAAGVIGLVEVLFQAGRGDAIPSRPFGGAAIFWLIVVCAFLAMLGRHNTSINFGDFDTGRVAILGSDYDYDASLKASPEGATRLVIDNIRGDLTVRGDGSDAVSVSGHKIVRAFSRSDAEKSNEQTPVRIEHQGDQLILTSTDSVSGRARVSADLEIAVPKSMAVEIRGRAGDISIQNVDGAVLVSSGRGDLTVQDIGGDVRVESSRGGSLRASNLRGAFDLSGRGGDVHIQGIAGPVTVSGEYSGSLEFSALAKSFRFQSSRTEFSAEAVPGAINMDLSDLRLENVSGPVRFHTSSRDIEARQITNALDLSVDRGDIKVDASSGPLPRIDVHSHNGDISLLLPAKTPFQLDGSTAQGEVENSFGSPLDVRSSGHSSSVTGGTGSGPEIKASTDRGTLSVRKG